MAPLRPPSGASSRAKHARVVNNPRLFTPLSRFARRGPTSREENGSWGRKPGPSAAVQPGPLDPLVYLALSTRESVHVYRTRFPGQLTALITPPLGAALD